MKKLICLLAISVMFLSIALAQDYNWGIGMRLGGDTGGVSVKYKLNTVDAFEAILAALWDNGFVATALSQRHIPVIGKGTHFYYGAGIHTGAGNRERKFIFGIDGIFGLEYKFRDVPLALALDYKPAFNVVGKPALPVSDIALVIRVTF